MGAAHAILHVKIMQLSFWAFELILYHTYFHKHLLQHVIIHLSQYLPTIVFLMQWKEICLDYCIVYFLCILSFSFIRNLISFHVHI